MSVKIEHLQEGWYLATSDDLPELTVQGKTLGQTMEFALDAAAKLVESYRDLGDPLPASLQRALRRAEPKSVTWQMPVEVPIEAPVS